MSTQRSNFGWKTFNLVHYLVSAIAFVTITLYYLWPLLGPVHEEPISYISPSESLTSFNSTSKSIFDQDRNSVWITNFHSSNAAYNFFTVHLKEKSVIRKISVLNTLSREYLGYAKIKKIKLTIGNEYYQQNLYLENSVNAFQVFTLSKPVLAQEIKMQVNKVFDGSIENQVAIPEIVIQSVNIPQEVFVFLEMMRFILLALAFLLWVVWYFFRKKVKAKTSPKPVSAASD